MMSDQPPDRMPEDEFYILCHWTVQTVAESMRITEDEARELLGAANEQGRLRILGNRWFAGVECDGRWIFVEGRRQLAEAAHEWQTLRAMQRQFED